MFYECYPQWKRFFELLGITVTVSGETSCQTISEGISAAVNEACYPVKVFYGHVAELQRRAVDCIFVPRLVSVEPKYYICPKFMGIPDMVRAQLGNRPPIIDFTVDCCRSSGHLRKELDKCADQLGLSRTKTQQAWRNAASALEEVSAICREGYTLKEAIAVWEGGNRPDKNWNKPKIGVLGHCYTINDPAVNMNLAQKLREIGVEPVMPEMMERSSIETAALHMGKRVFWSAGRRCSGAALYMDREPGIAGIVYLACFGCGPDSIVGAALEPRIASKPFMRLTLDEHSAETGMQTRLEAFYDMIRRRKRVESNLPAHGKRIYSL